MELEDSFDLVPKVNKFDTRQSSKKMIDGSHLRKNTKSFGTFFMCSVSTLSLTYTVFIHYLEIKHFFCRFLRSLSQINSSVSNEFVVYMSFLHQLEILMSSCELNCVQQSGVFIVLLLIVLINGQMFCSW